MIIRTVFGCAALVVLVVIGKVIFSASDLPYREGHLYKSEYRQLDRSGVELRGRISLIFYHDTYTLTRVETLGKDTSTMLRVGHVERIFGNIFELTTQHSSSEGNDLATMMEDANQSIYQKYSLQEGSVLRLVFFPAKDKKTICFYIVERQMVRCLSSEG